MALPSRPKTEPRPIQVTVRLSKKAVTYLKIMSKSHNLSQASVIEHLIEQEYRHFETKKNR